MPRFPTNFVDDLKAHADILQVIHGVVPLKKSGSTYKGLCPFHKEMCIRDRRIRASALFTRRKHRAFTLTQTKVSFIVLDVRPAVMSLSLSSYTTN